MSDTNTGPILSSFWKYKGKNLTDMPLANPNDTSVVVTISGM